MANTLKFSTLRFRTQPLDKMIIEEEVRQTNLNRCNTITGVSIPIALIIHAYYIFGNLLHESEQLTWVNKIFNLNVFMSAICLLLFLTGFWLKKKKKENDLLTIILPHLVFVVFATWGTLASVYNQGLDTSIVAFTIVCILNAATLLTKPLYLFSYLLIAYVFFSYGISLTQPDPDNVMYTLINGLCVVAVAFAMGTILWHNNMTRFKQDRLITSQQQILEHQYEKLVKSNEELEKSNASKDQFFSILAHDLRGPLNSSLALTCFLEEGAFEEDVEERQKMYSLLHNSLNNSSKLLENVLLWSTNQAGVINFKPKAMDVHDTIQASIDVLKIVAVQKRIEVINLVPKGISISADPDMMHTVFRNLLSNAIKFTPNSGMVKVHAETTLDIPSGKRTVQISVIDHGVGMSSRTLNNLFSVEKKMPGLGTNNETGTGLGLVLCKDFIEKHGGSIVVESEEHKGSKFMITLPEQN